MTENFYRYLILATLMVKILSQQYVIAYRKLSLKLKSELCDIILRWRDCRYETYGGVEIISMFAWYLDITPTGCSRRTIILSINGIVVWYNKTRPWIYAWGSTFHIATAVSKREACPKKT